jgi:hypothetical protein
MHITMHAVRASGRPPVHFTLMSEDGWKTVVQSIRITAGRSESITANYNSAIYVHRVTIKHIFRKRSYTDLFYRYDKLTIELLSRSLECVQYAYFM